MSKISMGPRALMYPTPAALVGANVDGKPNFMTVAWCGIACSSPPMVAVAIQPRRYTYQGIRQNSTFSVNIASSDMAREVDYCGIRSGSKVDKVNICHFRVFYGKLETAPLIEQCPINLECKVVHVLDLGSHSLVVGGVEESHVSESCLTDGQPDVAKIKPLIFAIAPSRQYHNLGGVIAKAFLIGEELKSRE